MKKLHRLSWVARSSVSEDDNSLREDTPETIVLRSFSEAGLVIIVDLPSSPLLWVDPERNSYPFVVNEMKDKCREKPLRGP